MPLMTRLWRNGFVDNLFTTVPKAVRVQLGLTPDTKIAWRVEGGVAQVRALRPEDEQAGVAGHSLYKQTRGNSLYTAIPMAVIEQLRLTNRSRAEWELQGDAAHVRRG